jgi:hypothetical protein
MIHAAYCFELFTAAVNSNATTRPGSEPISRYNELRHSLPSGCVTPYAVLVRSTALSTALFKVRYTPFTPADERFSSGNSNKEVIAFRFPTSRS